MRKKPYSEARIRSTITCLKSVARQADVYNTESVKEYIAKSTVSNNRKCILVDAMARIYDFKQVPFHKPIYQKILPLLFIPLEREVDDLISGASSKVATFLQLLKEAGLRPGEAWALKWTDLDYERNCLTCTPEENSNARQLKISPRLISMFNILPKQNKYIFHSVDVDPLYSLVKFRRTFQKQRRRSSD